MQILPCVISTGRPFNVIPTNKLFRESSKAVWFVGVGEFEEYVKHVGDPSRVIETPSLPVARNMAIEESRKRGCSACLQVSDDLRQIVMLNRHRKYTGKRGVSGASQLAKKTGKTPLKVEDAAEMILDQMKKTGCYLGGVLSTFNSGFSLQMEPVSEAHFIIGDLFVVDTINSNLLFDTRMVLKEDYEFTAQHLDKHGKVARLNRIMIRADHYTNKGGAVQRRTPALEKKMIKILLKKWPTFIIQNVRRKNEVLIRRKKRIIAALDKLVEKVGTTVFQALV